MDHADHVALIRGGVEGLEEGIWADIGSGTGAFTLALVELVGGAGSIVSVDRDAGALREQARRLAETMPNVLVRQIRADFTEPLPLGPLDGMVVANSLHFARDQALVLRSLVRSLRRGGRFVLVEYDAEAGNRWVPHPIPSRRWPDLAERAGLRETRALHRVPSRFLGAIYSALGVR
jgi:ubiquinone/menaquinone biosynthesis C-methylase UbiE